MDVKSLCMMSGRKASNRRPGVLHEIGETFNYDDVYCSDRYQMRVRLAGLACLTALRDKERHATLLHVSSFTAKQFREKELHSQRFRDKELRLCAFPCAYVTLSFCVLSF